MTRHPLISGKEVTGAAGERQVLNPYDNSVAGTVGYADRDQMERAVSEAHRVFQDWKRSASYERSQILRKTSNLIAERRTQFAETISRESGKPIAYASVEADRAVFTFAMAAEAALHASEGEILDMSVAPQGVGRSGRYQYFPLGVIAAITPFNFPLNLVAHKVAPAIAAGNTVVLKPAPQTPLSSFLLADVLKEAGLPEGVLQVVPCENDVAESLVRSEHVRMVSFTGSAPVGWKLKSIAGHARVTLELGGNGCVIVDDVENAVELSKTLTSAAFNYAGQVCISLQTLFVSRPFYEETLTRLIRSAGAAKVGDPMERETLVGPMISEAAARKVEAWIEQAVHCGAVRHTGEYRGPNWITPTVMTGVPHDTTLFMEEAFAPVLLVEPYDDISDVIEIVNRGKYGLQAGLFTRQIDVVERVYRELEVGGLIVNDANAFRLDTMPYGGVKSSGAGREGVMFAMREMSEMKLLVLKHKL